MGGRSARAFLTPSVQLSAMFYGRTEKKIQTKLNKSWANILFHHLSSRGNFQGQSCVDELFQHP